MDVLSHLFLPLIFIFGTGLFKSIRWYNILFLSGFSLAADFDVLLDIHRSWLHSPLLVLAVMLPTIYFARKNKFYSESLLVTLFLFSHILLDFFDGGIPLLYPFVSGYVGLDFPLVIKFGSYPIVEEFGPRLIFAPGPKPVHGMSANIFSEAGFISAFIFLAMLFYRKQVKK